jgi:antitoxin ParD1/3/4
MVRVKRASVGIVMVDKSNMRITLKPALAEAVQQAVDSGEYASQDEVVGEALLEWRLRRALSATERDTLCRLWDAGVASGPGRFNNMDEIRQEARRRWAEDQSRRQARE